ncbi:MAG: antitoxin component YwqK of YwqJK toxin-antitoxin module [Vicingaceae bacterium]|jgi:antitoxin component YwqK of YwqJK toxin-antitoxin module
MKFLSICIILLFFSCGVIAQSFELNGTDTINKIDVSRKRQGRWLIKAVAPKFKEYPVGNLVEEGNYINSRKEDIWKKYFPSTMLKSEITYKGSRPFGKYILYYENGNVEEASTWERTKNTGGFKRYHENGKLAQDFTFTEGGKRSGKQVYYHSNGELRLEGTWNEGLATGEQKAYYENGDVMSVKKFSADGLLDPTSFESYASKGQVEKPAEGKEVNVTAAEEEKANQGGFDGNGYKKLFNQNKQIAKDGEFQNYRLISGKNYLYDENGILETIMIFKDGKYVGNGVITKE